MYDQTMTQPQAGYAKGAEPGAIDELDRGLDGFENLLARLEERLAPIRSQYADEKVPMAPTPEPNTDLRRRTQRLRFQLDRLERIIDGVDL